MNDVVIRVENVSKDYRLGVIGHGTLSRDFQSKWAKILGKEDPNAKIDHLHYKPSNGLNERFRALNNVSFEVRRGEILGIIGCNGAGKSTLLKILSRVTAPSMGSIKVKGKVASLLEVGTGFHPELTGRENVFLNGAILGMRKGEIEEKFDEILNFAEVDKFIDTPVKRYSSGMYVRLAFSVAAHLDPEILVVDEVLSVGDASFQKKCLGKMGEVSREGRTVLLVSHSMPTIENLCNRVIWIDNGEIIKDGETKKIVADYIDQTNKNYKLRDSGTYQNFGHRRGSGEIQFTSFRLIKEDGSETKSFMMGETIRVEVLFNVLNYVEIAVFGFGIVDSLTQVFVTNWTDYNNPQSFIPGEKGTFIITIPNNCLRSRNYHFYLGVTGNSDIPYDIWDGVGTEFMITYPEDMASLTFSIGRDVALVSMPICGEILKK